MIKGHLEQREHGGRGTLSSPYSRETNKDIIDKWLKKYYDILKTNKAYCKLEWQTF